MPKQATKAVEDLVPGDKVDLEGDSFADPDRDNPFLACEYVEVTEVKQETPNCVAVTFEGFDQVGFPRGHFVPLKP